MFVSLKNELIKPRFALDEKNTVQSPHDNGKESDSVNSTSSRRNSAENSQANFENKKRQREQVPDREI
jgi:hypothetical protein